ncbi:MAG: aminopeptidase [Calditrichota bacterium]
MVEEITLHINPEYRQGAYNAIHVCLQVKPDERVTIVAGYECREIVAALQEQLRKIEARHSVLFLEDLGKRPCLKLPKEVLIDLKESQVSIYAAHAMPGELAGRSELTGFVNEHRIRHAHMVNISHQIMLQGMRADFKKVDELSARLIAKARQAETITAKSTSGTDIEARFIPELNWLKTSGIISVEKWGNLPGGEILTSPARVDGIFVVDGVVGDFLCERYGDLRDNPLRIEIENSRIRNLECKNAALLEDFSNYISTDENSNRAGEFAIGTNIAVTEVIGNILQDEKIPGIHIAFGDPYGEHTGQNWQSETHIDCVGRHFDIWLEQEKVMEDGVFIF